MNNKNDDGRKVKRIREILGIKQDALAKDLRCNQQRMSYIEQKKNIDDLLMGKIAFCLKVPVEKIRNFNEVALIEALSGKYIANDPPFGSNPVDKLIESYGRK